MFFLLRYNTSFQKKIKNIASFFRPLKKTTPLIEEYSWKSIRIVIAFIFVIVGEYDDTVKGLKRAEDDTSLETEADNALRRRKLPKRYIDSDEDNEDKKNNMLPRKEKNFRRNKVRRLSESNDDENDNKTLPLVNSDVLNAVKENSIHVRQIQDKERERESA